MSAQDTIGKLIDTSEKRDAIHIAMAPVIAGQKLFPGQDIGFVTEGDFETVGMATSVIKALGIVDPYLKGPVFPGDRFWMFLYPNTISSLRHEWVHEAFGEVKPVEPAKPPEPPLSPPPLDQKELSRAWITQLAEKLGKTCDAMLDDVSKWSYKDEARYETAYKVVTAIEWSLFWAHYSLATGKKPPPDEDVSPGYSCPC